MIDLTKDEKEREAYFTKLKAAHREKANGMCRYAIRGGIVECDTLQPCERCGWNPVEEFRRKHEVTGGSRRGRT